MDKETQKKTEYDIANELQALIDALPEYSIDREVWFDGRWVDAVLHKDGNEYAIEIKRVHR